MTTKGMKAVEVNFPSHPMFQIATGPWRTHPVLGPVFEKVVEQFGPAVTTH